MTEHLYRELTAWYHLLDPHEEHAEETAIYERFLSAPRVGTASTLLELGSGRGNNAWHLKHRFTTTLVDLSPEMLALSRALNPTCEHVEGDMRSVRLDRTFDAVLVHDAIMYMLTETDLRAAMATAFEHTRSGGVALFTPDCTAESFRESTELFSKDEPNDGLGMRVMAWAWDPDPNDCTFVTDYAFFLRRGAELEHVHDRHVEGLFSAARWIELLEATGFVVEHMERPVEPDGTPMFVGHKP